MEHLFKKAEFDVDKFLNEISHNIKLKISGFTHTDGWVHVFISSPLDPMEYTQLQTAVSDHDPNRQYTAAEQKQQDEWRFQQRASKKNEIISKMAAGNLERVRNAEWTTADLVALTQDAELKNLLDDVNTLSYEIAYSKIDAISNSLITQTIKDEWKQLLLEHFYL